MTRTLLDRGLPRLGAKTLWAYRIVWTAIAAASLASMGALLVEGVDPAITGLRLVKTTIVLSVAALLFWRRPRDPVAALLALAFLCWIVTSNVDFTTEALLPMILDRVRFFLFALAILLFPDGTWARRSNRWVGTAAGVAALLGLAELGGLAPTRLYWPLAIACVVVAIGSLVQRFRSTSDESQQQQLKWVALGLTAGVGAILAARTGNAVRGPSIALEGLFQVGVVLVALGFLVPLLRYRLYDAEAAISRSAALAILTLALVGTFAAAESIIEWVGQQVLGMAIGNVSAAIAAAVAAVLLNPLHSRISNWVEQRFQRDLVQLKVQVSELLDEVPPSWSPRQVGKTVLPLIIEAVHANGAAIVLDGELIAEAGKLASSERCALELPLHYHFTKLRGRLLIGPRLDGCSYGKDEAEALESIIPKLSRTLATSLERAEARRRTCEFKREVHAELGKLSARAKELERRFERQI